MEYSLYHVYGHEFCVTNESGLMRVGCINTQYGIAVCSATMCCHSLLNRDIFSLTIHNQLAMVSFDIITAMLHKGPYQRE